MVRSRWGKILFFFIFLGVLSGLLWYSLGRKLPAAESASRLARAIASFDVQNPIPEEKDATLETDLFGEDGVLNLLILGLDNRVGKNISHCDAIQFLELDKNRGTLRITAVPRGTYSPLPPGLGAATGDFYLANACGLVGLEYGVSQIENILGKKADFVATIGFSRALGLFRELKLPPGETLRWLRLRQGYALGEPQRAHNHSTFIKQLIVRFTPKNHSVLDAPFQYLLYNFFRTDLSFTQARQISRFLTEAAIYDSPEKISLFIKPALEVKDIDYDPETAKEYLTNQLKNVKNHLNRQDYSDRSQEEIEEQVRLLLKKNSSDPEFIAWAYQNQVWQQFEDDTARQEIWEEIVNRQVDNEPLLSRQLAVLDSYLQELAYHGLTGESQNRTAARLEYLQLSPCREFMKAYLDFFSPQQKNGFSR